MKYRTLAGEKVSALGYGCMRFPLEGESDRDIDINQAEAMLYRAYESGVNYFDTAYPYHGGASETMLGEFLHKNNLRSKVKIATKCPTWSIKSPEDFDTILNDQLKKLQTDHIDFYLMHALDKDRIEIVKKNNIIEKLNAAKAEGKIRHIGFSFHDDLDSFKKIVDTNPAWEFCQIQLNYVNTEYQAGIAGLEYAHQKGLDVIIMEPLLGGRLANLSPYVQKAFDESRTPVEWALDFLWNREEVSVILSGMGAMEQVESNVEYASRAEVGMLGEKELSMLREAKRIYEEMSLVPCTKCAYCMPCPFGLNIPKIFEAYNLTGAKEMMKARKLYEALETGAAECRKCRRCEKLCPQSIKISEEMTKAAAVFKREG